MLLKLRAASLEVPPAPLVVGPRRGLGDTLILGHCTAGSVLDAHPGHDEQPPKWAVPASQGRFPRAALALRSSGTATSWLSSTGLAGRMLNTLLIICLVSFAALSSPF